MTDAKLISFTSDWQNLIAYAASKCYGKKLGIEGVKRIVKAGHLSILEHAHATFDVTADLATLGQITRHRHISFTVKSSRGADFDSYNIPAEIKMFPEAATIFRETVEHAFLAYERLQEIGISKQHAAYTLPKAAKTTFCITGNFRAWYEYLQKRLCLRAMPEHQKLAKLVHSQLAGIAPEIFGGCLLNCENCEEEKCSF